MSQTTEAINAARVAVDALFDATRRWLDDPIPRELVVDPYQEALAHLHDALKAATRPPEVDPAEDGVALRDPGVRDG